VATSAASSVSSGIDGWKAAVVCLALTAMVAGSEPRPELHVATLNLAHGRGLALDQFRVPPEEFAGNIDAVARVIRQEKPDVLALQEADAPSAWSGGFDHVGRLAAATEYPHVYHGLHFQIDVLNMAVRYGTALLAKDPLLAPVSVRFEAPPLHTKGFVVAEIEFDGRMVMVTSVHLDSGSSEVRRAQAQVLIRLLDQRGPALILMGDFNSRWENEADAVRILAVALGLQAFQPESTDLATFPSRMPKKRIDWILISSELEFVDYQVCAACVSDHLGVAARVRWR